MLATVFQAISLAKMMQGIWNMADQIALTLDPMVTTTIAANLNAAMARNADARARYLAIYGEEWAPLGNGAEINDTASATAATVR